MVLGSNARPASSTKDDVIHSVQPRSVATGVLHLEYDASRHEIANDGHDDQTGVPDFAVGLVFFKLMHQNKSDEETGRDTIDR